jgi:hypothetical protein
MSALLDEAAELLRIAHHAHQKMGLEGEGNRGHSHEVRMFAMHFSQPETPKTPEHTILSGDGRFWKWWLAYKAAAKHCPKCGADLSIVRTCPQCGIGDGWTPGREITPAQLEAACAAYHAFGQTGTDPAEAWAMLADEHKPAIRARVKAVIEAGRGA